MSDWVLHLGDCLDPVTGLASLADRSVDHVITDAPLAWALHQIAKVAGYLGRDFELGETLDDDTKEPT